MRAQSSPLQKPQQGVVLLEALIAILIFSMGILALVGLQAAMIQNTADARYRAEASFIAQQRLGEIWTDPGNLASYVEDETDISHLLPNGLRTVEVPAADEVVVTITWQPPGQERANRFITNARISGS